MGEGAEITEERVYEVIRDYCEQRRAVKFAPYAICFRELIKLLPCDQKCLKSQINALYTKKRIKYYRNVNQEVYLHIGEIF